MAFEPASRRSLPDQVFGWARDAILGKHPAARWGSDTANPTGRETTAPQRFPGRHARQAVSRAANRAVSRAASRAGLPLTLFAATAAVELVAVAMEVRGPQWVAKPLLAPLLVWYLANQRRGGLVALALCFATAGDIALLVHGQVPFLIGMLFFLGTHVSLIVAFLRWARPRGWAFAGYGALWALANLLLWNQLGDLRVPVLGYSLALSVMAASAAGVSRRVAAGGALFLISDLLIGAGAAGVRLPAQHVLVMSTYSAALALIATGWARLPVVGRATR